MEHYKSVIGHELRTPIQSIILIVKNLIKSSNQQQSAEFSLNLMLSQLEFIESFIEDLLNVRLIREGLLTLQNESFSPKEALEFVVHMFKTRSMLLDVKVSLQIGKDLLMPVPINS